jgi:hypothetical protein
MRPSCTLALPLVLSLLSALMPAPALAQVKERKPKPSPQVFCDPSRAVALVREQLSEAKVFDDPARRISLMARAAELLWPSER